MLLALAGTGRDGAGHPTMHKTAPSTENDLTQMSIVPRLRHLCLNLESHLLGINPTGNQSKGLVNSVPEDAWSCGIEDRQKLKAASSPNNWDWLGGSQHVSSMPLGRH